MSEVEPIEDGEELLTIGQAAARLGLARTWVLRLIQDGRLPAVRHTSPRSPIGDYWEVRAADLEAVRGLKKSGRPPKI